MALPKMVEDNTMKMVVMTCMNTKEKMIREQAVDEYRSIFGPQVKNWPERMRELFLAANADEEMLEIFDGLIYRYYGKRF